MKLKCYYDIYAVQYVDFPPSLQDWFETM